MAAPLTNELLADIKAVGGHNAVVNDIKTNAEDVAKHLKHVDTLDKSKPSTDGEVHVHKWDKEGFLKEIESPPELKHVEEEEVDDRSSPLIEPTVSLKLNEHDKLLQEIASPPHLKHVDTVDKAAPKITKTACVQAQHSGELPATV